MPSIMEVFQVVCTHQPPLIAEKSYKNVKTAVKRLASAYGTTPEKLSLTPAIEAGYREQIHTYFDQHPTGHFTVRNTLNFLAALWKAYHTLDQTPQVPRQVPRVPSATAALKRLQEQSPYGYIGSLQQKGYRIPPEQWPGDISIQWAAFAAMRAHEIRWITFDKDEKSFAYYVSYHLLSAEDRLAALPDEAQAKLQTEGKYAGWLREIKTPPIVTSWDELFEPDRLNSYITWSTWRCWRWQDAILKEREPQRPSAQGRTIAQALVQVAKSTDHPKHAEIRSLWGKLKDPLKVHDKKDPRHRFELAELEAVALELIAEARRMKPNYQSRYPGMVPALRYQLGLILQLAWRNPMRARNWCEAIRGHNLKKDEHGRWRWRFEGPEMKIGMRNRGRDINVFEPDVPPEVAVYLDEFLAHYRPHLKNADSDPHVFLARGGTKMHQKSLCKQLRVHVNRYTDKRLYPHLLRSLFSTHHLSHGMDINSVAYAMNDTPQAVLKAYNELMADKHRPVIADANRQALTNGHKPLTPPVIPITPKPLKTNPDQMNLL